MDRKVFGEPKIFALNGVVLMQSLLRSINMSVVEELEHLIMQTPDPALFQPLVLHINLTDVELSKLRKNPVLLKDEDYLKLHEAKIIDGAHRFTALQNLQDNSNDHFRVRLCFSDLL